MKRFSKIIVSLLLSISILTLLTGCGSDTKDSGTSDKVSVRIAYFPNITHPQALVMKNQQSLEKKWKDKCDVSWTSFNAGPAEMEAIFAGEIDLGYIGPVPAVSANSKSNGDVKIISNATNAGAVLLARKDANIKSVKDLSGKKVAVPQLGNTQHLCLIDLLNQNGLKAVDKGGDVTINASSNADIVNLIDNGTVDAACVPEPWGTTIEKKGNADIVLDYDKLYMNGDYPVAVVVASGDFMNDHPDLVKEFLEAHKDATLFINDKKEEAIKAVNDEINNATGKSLDGDIIKSAFGRMVVSDSLNKSAIMQFANVSKNEGFITQVPEEEDVFRTEFN